MNGRASKDFIKKLIQNGTRALSPRLTWAGQFDYCCFCGTHLGSEPTQFFYRETAAHIAAHESCFKKQKEEF